MNSSPPQADLYPRLLGSAWEALDPAVQRFHLVGDRRRFRGIFRVERGRSLAARVLAPLLRLPRAAEAEQVTLEVALTEKSERWTRRFGRKRLASEMWAGADGLLVERLGPFECRFRLTVEDGALTYRLVAAAFRLGRVRLPLPRALMPRGEARESAAPEPAAGKPGSVAGEVRISFASGKLLLAYGGRIALEEAPP